MGLKSTFAKAAAVAFKAADDIPADIKIRRTIPGAYNPATGKTDPATTTDYPAQAIQATYRQNEIDGTAIKTTDRKMTVRQAEVSEMGTVTTSDKVVLGTTVKTIVNVQADGAGVLWILQVRG